MRVGYLGPEGTFSHEALIRASEAEGAALVPLPTIHDAVLAVHERKVERALVPIENSREGAVNATLDALAFETDDVAIVGELVHPVRHCLVAREPRELGEIVTVVSHPQASGQCARFLRSELPDAAVLAAISTADAVRQVARRDDVAAALGTRLAAELYGCVVLREGVEDDHANETRFVWVAPTGAVAPPPAGARAKTALMFWGAGSVAPGWLVRCLSEFAFRGVNLVRIESRPLRQGLGAYMFFVDLEGTVEDTDVAGAIGGLRTQAETVRVLGSFPVA
jgi:prephenate dehydratase